MFMPQNPITEAQALTIVVRSLYGYQDETVLPWYNEYFSIAQNIGLITDETRSSVNNTNVTRSKLAQWLYDAFYYDVDTTASQN
jgi:hypothetical protein